MAAFALPTKPSTQSNFEETIMNTATTEDMADKMADKARPAMDRVTNLMHTVSDKAANAKTQASDWIGEHGEQLSAAQKKMVEETSRYVAAHPLKVLGVAVVAALLVGRFMR
jgi:ElaB/YqjD/DUF883 family membrane-anchored ribosome-binding protein